MGKAPGARPASTRSDINALLVERGRPGETVVRLKGGDPFVFARGGEEAAALAAAGVPFEVVPGITSAIAVPAYAGIPVTLRHSSTSVTIVTGHEDPCVGEEGTVDWRGRGPGRRHDRDPHGGGPHRAHRRRRCMAGGPPAGDAGGRRPVGHPARAAHRAGHARRPSARAELGSPSTIVVGDVAA